MHPIYGGEKTPQELYDHLSQLDSGYTPEACAEYAEWIHDIKRLKHEHDAVILAHNYQRRRNLRGGRLYRVIRSNSPVRPKKSSPTRSCSAAYTSWPRRPRL